MCVYLHVHVRALEYVQECVHYDSQPLMHIHACVQGDPGMRLTSP